MIDADRLLETLSTGGHSSVRKVISREPTIDAVEVVRCMHCKWFKTNTDKENYCDRHSAVWYKFYIRPDDFCSYGERKEVKNA